MRVLISCMLLSCTLACQVNTQSALQESREPIASDSRSDWQRDLDNSTQFLMDYVQFLSRENPEQGSINLWIKEHRLLTEAFQNAYQVLLDSAWKANPDYGLGFDPIFDAQDFPTDEFYVIDHDSLSKTIHIGSKQWPDFSLLIQMDLVQNHYLIDKMGIVNNQ